MGDCWNVDPLVREIEKVNESKEFEMNLIKFTLAPPRTGTALIFHDKISAVISQRESRIKKQKHAHPEETAPEDGHLIPDLKSNMIKEYEFEDATITIVALDSGAEVRVTESADEVLARMKEAEKKYSSVEDHLSSIDMELSKSLGVIGDRLEEIATTLDLIKSRMK